MIGSVLAVQALAALGGAVGQRHGQRLAGREVRRRQLDHLAGAHEQHPHLAQVLEQLQRQAHRRRRHAYRMGTDLGGAAHLLGHREGTLEQLVQRAAQGAGQPRFAHGELDLAQDLRLAQHHGIESGGDAERVACRRAALGHVGMVGQLGGAGAALLGQPGQRRLRQVGCRAGHRRIAGRHVELGAIAGGQQRGLGCGARQALAQRVQRRRQPLGREGETGANVQRRAVVVQADGQHGHRPAPRPSRPRPGGRAKSR